MSNFRNDFSKDLDDLSWSLGKVFVKVIVPVMLVSSAIGAVYWGCDKLSTPAKLVDQTLDPNNIVFNYEYFHQAYEDIKALDTKIVQADAQVEAYKKEFSSRKEMDRDDKIELARLQAILIGLKQERLTEVSAYNARSRMINRDLFKSKSLPSTIE